jgi:hypothetical protein
VAGESGAGLLRDPFVSRCRYVLPLSLTARSRRRPTCQSARAVAAVKARQRRPLQGLMAGAGCASLGEVGGGCCGGGRTESHCAAMEGRVRWAVALPR